MKSSLIQVQMQKGLLEFCILHIISRGDTDVADMVEELKEAQLIEVEVTLYPLLNRLKNAALISHRWVEADLRPLRKYYSITSDGSDLLLELDSTWSFIQQSVRSITSKQ